MNLTPSPTLEKQGIFSFITFDLTGTGGPTSTYFTDNTAVRII
jgi:hypothetical protein